MAGMAGPALPAQGAGVKLTFGELVDRLSIVNVKLYMIQDRVNFSAKTDQSLDAKTTKKLVDLNQQRNKLMTEIDQCLDESIKAGRAEIDPHVKI
jgi:hypothetical protein